MTRGVTQHVLQSLKTFLRDYDDPLLTQEDGATLEEPSPASSARSSVNSSPLSPLSEWPVALAVEQELARMTHEEYLSLSSEKWTQRLQKHNVVLADVLSSVDRAALLRNIYIYFMKRKSAHVETKTPKVHSKNSPCYMRSVSFSSRCSTPTLSQAQSPRASYQAAYPHQLTLLPKDEAEALFNSLSF